MKILTVNNIVMVILVAVHNTESQTTINLSSILGKCHNGSPKFDNCLKNMFNELRIFFKTGIPEFNIKPFDPHKAAYIEQRRGDEKGLIGYKLVLRNVSEYGWIHSEVIKLKTDPKNNELIYTQYFPEKSLDGLYDFSANIGQIPYIRKGFWNLTLYDYSQTTTVKRLGGLGSILKIHVHVDKIGGMKLHISDIFGSEWKLLNNVADSLINNFWQPGVPFVKPLINDLVSTAFTDIFNESFRYFPLKEFIK